MNNLVTTPNQDLIRMAKDKVAVNWGQAILAFVVYMLISMVIGFIPFASLILGGALMLGWSLWSLNVKRNGVFRMEDIFDGFNNFTKALGTYLLMVVLIILWTLLLIIPGIIKALAYSQAMYVLADNPDINAMDALRKSEEMMKGNKTKYFLMMLIFFLLSILCLFTLGIGFLFLAPVMQVTMAEFYDEIRTNMGEMEDEVSLIGEE
jgi:uncharacterized membrane protein